MHCPLFSTFIILLSKIDDEQKSGVISVKERELVVIPTTLSMCTTVLTAALKLRQHNKAPVQFPGKVSGKLGFIYMRV